MASGSPTYTFTFQFVGPGEILALGIALPLTSILIVALRFWVRRVQQVHTGIDDWLSLAGLVRFPRDGSIFKTKHPSSL